MFSVAATNSRLGHAEHRRRGVASESSKISPPARRHFRHLERTVAEFGRSHSCSSPRCLAASLPFASSVFDAASIFSNTVSNVCDRDPAPPPSIRKGKFAFRRRAVNAPRRAQRVGDAIQRDSEPALECFADRGQVRRVERPVGGRKLHRPAEIEFCAATAISALGRYRLEVLGGQRPVAKRAQGLVVRRRSPGARGSPCLAPPARSSRRANPRCP